MFNSRQMNGQTIENKHNLKEEPALTPKHQKQDALDLAELIYDIFQDSLSSANMEEKGQ